MSIGNGIHRVEKNGHTYWQFVVRDPEKPGRWQTVSASRRLFRTFDLDPIGEITRDDVVALKALVEKEMRETRKRKPEFDRAEVRLSELFRRYLTTRCRNNVEQTLEQKKDKFDLFIRLFGDLPISAVTEEHASRFIDHLQKKLALGNNTVRDYFGYLKSAFDFGMAIGLLRSNFFRLVPLPKKVSTKTPYWTPEEIKAHLEANFMGEHWDYVRWAVVGPFMLGLSPMEWQNADWKYFDESKSAVFIEVTKEKSSTIRKAWVPIPDVLMPAFRARMKSEGRIWLNSREGAYSRQALCSMLRRISWRWPKFNWLSLRKSTSIYLQERGIDLLPVAKVLRHQDAVPGGFRTLMGHYSTRHLDSIRPVVNEAFADCADLARLAMPTVTDRSDTSRLRLAESG